MLQTLLIVEDHDDIAPLEIALSSLNGYTVCKFSNGNDVLRWLRNAQCELAAVITDLNLPDVDGFALIEFLRSEPRFARLPILAMSGDNRPEVRGRVLQLGANAFFAKPYSPAEVRQALKALLHAK
jgi:DNA-binding response OmpR family regulator